MKIVCCSYPTTHKKYAKTSWNEQMHVSLLTYVLRDESLLFCLRQFLHNRQTHLGSVGFSCFTLSRDKCAKYVKNPLFKSLIKT